MLYTLPQSLYLLQINFNHEDLFLWNGWAAKVSKIYFRPGKLPGRWSGFECVQNISSGAIEWSCAADLTTISQWHKKTLTEIEASYIECMVKVDKLFANWVQAHLKRLWCWSGVIRCRITNSFVSNWKTWI